jgi:hypothetical protein
MVLVAWVAPDFDPIKHAVNLLDEGQLLVVTRGSPEHLDLAEARTGRVRTEYVAQGKEKLAEVARKFGMGSHDLARINRISYDTVLSKGQTIIVYQVADPGRSKRADEQWRKTPRGRRGRLAGTHTDRTASANVPGDGEDDSEDDAKPGDAAKSDSEPKRTSAKSENANAPKTRDSKPRADSKSESHADSHDSEPSSEPTVGGGAGGPVTSPGQAP